MARTHHVDFSIPAELPTEFVVVDVTQINQVLSILFQNALDAVNDNDAKKKSIEAIARMKDGKVIIAIADSGKGVAASAATQLFQPFFSTKENGTGLGLISARNILETYGSHLEFSNLPEGGCSFSFALPTAPRA
jgi:C4-dicarboxylate-specific signal transduction histidine kinase